MADIAKTINDLERWIDWMDEDAPVVALDALALLKEQRWHDASKRPPRNGRYIVWGLHEFTPDHCDEPNAYWQTQIAQWSDMCGWDVKVKFWMKLPDTPNP